MKVKTAEKRPDRIFLSVPDLREQDRQAAARHLAGLEDAAAHNREVEALEREFSSYLGFPAAAVASGTAAIHLGLRLLGAGPGDRVLTPTLTFVASCNPILYEGAIPVFLDSERATWNIDPALLRDTLETQARRATLPKVLIVVHLFGQSADMAAIMPICQEFGVAVLEDAAESLGALCGKQPAGTFGQVSAFSFNRNKVVTGLGGGVIASPNAALVDKARHWSAQACDPGPDYLHSEVGYNYRLSNLLAALARSQFQILSSRVDQRRAVAFRYRDAFADLPGITLMPQASHGLHTNWLSCFLIDESRFGVSQRELIRFLDAANVEARPVWKPMHTQKLYERYERVGGEVAEDLNRRGICLPSSSCLSPAEQQFVIDRVRESHFLAREGRFPAPGAKP